MTALISHSKPFSWITVCPSGRLCCVHLLGKQYFYVHCNILFLTGNFTIKWKYLATSIIVKVHCNFLFSSQNCSCVSQGVDWMQWWWFCNVVTFILIISSTYCPVFWPHSVTHFTEPGEGFEQKQAAFIFFLNRSFDRFYQTLMETLVLFQWVGSFASVHQEPTLSSPKRFIASFPPLKQNILGCFNHWYHFFFFFSLHNSGCSYFLKSYS